MNKFFSFLLLLALSFGAAVTLNAQPYLGTDDDGFVVQITSPASIVQTIFHGADAGVCQWVGQSSNNGATPWGADLTESLCGDVVWADDSLACGALTNDLTGKIALIRRGSCGFSVKCYWAQKKGAKAVIILNHYANPADGPCSTYVPTGQLFGGMAGLDSAAAVNIPAIFLERETGEQIDGALKAGQPVNICFNFLRMTTPTSASQYATPLTQVDSMRAITVTYNNRSGAVQPNVKVKAEFYNPSGTKIGTMTSDLADVAPSVDNFIVFPSFYAPPAKGKHTVLYTNDQYTESIDSVYSYFEHTDYTFATDNLTIDPGGIGPTNALFEANNFEIQNGGLTFTGQTPTKVTYATFGIANIDSVFVPNADPVANTISIALYKADADGDGNGEISAATSSFADLGAGLLGYADYVMTGNEVNDQLIHVPLTDLITSNLGVDLEANSLYYITLYYNGLEAGTGRSIRFSNSLDVEYASFDTYYTTPVFIDQMYGGWQGAKVIQRLQIEGFTPTIKTAEPKLLAASKINITPNPASTVLNLELNLEAVNPVVAVSILDGKGQIVVGTQMEKSIQKGVMTLNVTSLPSGVYYLWIRTSEGSTMKQVVVAH